MRQKQHQFSDDLKSLNNKKIKELTDEEIYNYLKHEIGMSIGPLVQSTRPLYEKILSDSIGHLDDIDEFLNNFTKTGGENKRRRSSESTKTTDSGHGNSMNFNNTNNDLNNSNGVKLLDNSNGINQLDNSNHNSIHVSTPIDSAANDREGHGTTTESVSNRSNISNRTNSSNRSIAIESNKFLNIPTPESITSPIVPIIKITSDLNQPNLDTLYPSLHNLHQTTKTTATLKNTNTYCSTPIDRQATILNNNPKRMINVIDDNARTSESTNVHLARTETTTAPITNLASKTSNLFKNANVNRNVFKNFVQTNLRDNTDNRSSATNRLSDGLIHRNLESKFKTVQHTQPSLPTTAYHLSNHLSNEFNSQPTKTNSDRIAESQQPTHQPLATKASSLQFSDREDDEEESEGGIAFEYKVPTTNKSQMPRSRISNIKQRIPARFTKSEYLKRTVPNYQTNQSPPTTNWLKSFLLFLLSLLIFSFVLAVTSYL